MIKIVRTGDIPLAPKPNMVMVNEHFKILIAELAG